MPIALELAARSQLHHSASMFVLANVGEQRKRRAHNEGGGAARAPFLARTALSRDPAWRRS
jgi:hypothetical protein